MTTPSGVLVARPNRAHFMCCWVIVLYKDYSQHKRCLFHGYVERTASCHVQVTGDMFDNFILQHRQEKQKRGELRLVEKRQDFKQLMEYNPWGKPGGGAPTQRIAKSNVFGEDGPIEHTFLAFGKPGHGAPNKTRSGRLRTRLPADPSIRFGLPSLHVVGKGSERDPSDQAHNNDIDFSGAIFASTNSEHKSTRQRQLSSLKVVENPRRESPVRPTAGLERQHCQPGPVGLLEKLGWRQRTSPTASFSGIDDKAGRSFNLPSTDVTRQKLRCRFERPTDRTQHENDLRLQVEERCRIMAQRRDEEREENLRHFETWSSFWGRPGHGAPNDTSDFGHRRRVINNCRPSRRAQ